MDGGCEADNLLQYIFDGAVLYKGRKLMEIPMEEFPQPIDVFNFSPEFHEVHTSAVFRTHWNNEKNSRSSSAAGARQSPSLSFSKRMRLSKATDSEVDALSFRPQSRATPVMIEEEERRNFLSQSFSSLYQCSSWTSKSTGREQLSILIWLLSGIGGAADAGKYGTRVVDEGFLLYDSEMVGFQAAVGSARTSSAQLIESRGVINLPTTVSTNISGRFNMGIESCGSLVVLVRLTVHREEGQTGYDDSNFNFTSAATTPGSKVMDTQDDQDDEPISTPGAEVRSL